MSHTNFNGNRFAAGSTALVAVGVGALGVGIVNAMQRRQRADGIAFTVAEYNATIDFLEAHCLQFERETRALRRQNARLEAQNRSLNARLQTALYRIGKGLLHAAR